MKNAFSKIIILLNASFGVLMSASVMADYMVCDEAGNCTNVHTSSTTSAPTSNSIQIPASSGNNQYSSAEYAKQMAAKEAAAEQGRKLEECGKQKALVPISQGQCKAQANTYMTSWSVQNCQAAGGVFWPSFAFDSTYFSIAVNYPQQVQYSSYAQCEKLTAAAIIQFQADCTSTGDLVVVKTCEAAGVK